MHYAEANIFSSAATVAPRPFARMFAKFAMVCAVYCVAVLVRVGRAFAYSAGSSATSGHSGVIKFLAVGGAMVGAYMFLGSDDGPRKPMLTETDTSASAEEADPFNVMGREMKPQGEEQQPEKPKEPEPEPPAAPEFTVGATDDSSLFGGLNARMQQLAAEQAAAAEEELKKNAQDSTDSWGTGSQAVLEPPKPGDEDGGNGGPIDPGSALDFPPGFPIIDGEVREKSDANGEPPAPIASAEQLAMLNRMMGGGE